MWSPPPTQDNAQPSRLKWVLGVMLVVAMALGGALAGLIGSYMVANRSHPTDADIRAAAKSLVPPGAKVSGYGAGVPGGNPLDPGPYNVSFDVTIDEHDFGRRQEVFHNLAQSTGWVLTGRSSGPGGASAEFERAGLYLTVFVSVSDKEPQATVIVERTEGARPVRRALGATLGAAAGMVSAGLVLAFTRRRSAS